MVRIKLFRQGELGRLILGALRKAEAEHGSDRDRGGHGEEED